MIQLCMARPEKGGQRYMLGFITQSLTGSCGVDLCYRLMKSNYIEAGIPIKRFVEKKIIYPHRRLQKDFHNPRIPCQITMQCAGAKTIFFAESHDALILVKPDLQQRHAAGF